jgi:hypothetical protein
LLSLADFADLSALAPNALASSNSFSPPYEYSRDDDRLLGLDDSVSEDGEQLVAMMVGWGRIVDRGVRFVCVSANTMDALLQEGVGTV